MLFVLEDDQGRIDEFQRCVAKHLPELSMHIERTAPEAIEWLSKSGDTVSVISLDHDLVVPDFDGDEGDGRDVVKWLTQNTQKVPVIIHTTNGMFGPSMEQELNEHGWRNLWIVPYNDLEWVEETWTKALKNFVS